MLECHSTDKHQGTRNSIEARAEALGIMVDDILRSCRLRMRKGAEDGQRDSKDHVKRRRTRKQQETPYGYHILHDRMSR